MSAEPSSDAAASPPPLDAREREQVLEAATDLLSLHGPNSVTWRWLGMVSSVPADRIRVEWEELPALVASVLDRLSALVDGYAGRELDADEQQQLHHVIDRFQCIVARALLDGVNVASQLNNSAEVARWRQFLQARYDLDDVTVRYRLSQTMALEWGWRLFGPHIKELFELADVDEGRMQVEIRRLENQIFKLPPIDEG